MVCIAGVLWLAVLVGTYIIFPPYRATPPDGVTDLSQYPRSLLLANPDTAWLHAFAMESKEHMPWIASMLATAVAFVSVRYQSTLLRDAQLRNMAMILLTVSFALVSFVGLMGIFVDKWLRFTRQGSGFIMTTAGTHREPTAAPGRDEVTTERPWLPSWERASAHSPWASLSLSTKPEPSSHQRCMPLPAPYPAGRPLRSWPG